MNVMGIWMCQIAGSEIEDILAMLSEQWSSINATALSYLSQWLVSLDPDSIVVLNGKTWLRLTNRQADTRIVGSSAYLLPPHPAHAAFLEKLRAHGIASTGAFAEFLTQFGGYQCQDFEQFLAYYVDFRKTPGVFDSYGRS
jgi:hypothetical protein